MSVQNKCDGHSLRSYGNQHNQDFIQSKPAGSKCYEEMKRVLPEFAKATCEGDDIQETEGTRQTRMSKFNLISLSEKRSRKQINFGKRSNS